MCVRGVTFRLCNCRLAAAAAAAAEKAASANLVLGVVKLFILAQQHVLSRDAGGRRHGDGRSRSGCIFLLQQQNNNEGKDERLLSCCNK
ncbi:hypothetical protein JOB18_019506 [Solea senegalensis]|uniref:Secreted protein n=1 Tax=Solea senegalensis TaxID=28829 RepID=A0AAV6S942_SOLSE|nr:hypothetical protein JOB18_019506 [Solea senegalensis]